MATETAILAGVLFAGAVFLILQHRFVRILFGFVLLTNAANLIVLSSAPRPDNLSAPLLMSEPGPYVDPLPQALILTAIVIAFGTTAYLVLLLYRLFLDQKTSNARELYKRDPHEEEPS